MNYTLGITLLLLQITSAADLPLSVSCSDELVTFSMCLPYVAEPPNNNTDSPPPQCCDIVSSAFTNSSAVCLCYLIRNPMILGFPINSTKLMSLTTVCQNSAANLSLERLCSDSEALPPLRSITDPSNGKSREFDSPPATIIVSSQAPSDDIQSPDLADEPPNQLNLSNTSSAIETRAEFCLSILLPFLVYLFA